MLMGSLPIKIFDISEFLYRTSKIDDFGAFFKNWSSKFLPRIKDIVEMSFFFKNQGNVRLFLGVHSKIIIKICGTNNEARL